MFQFTGSEGDVFLHCTVDLCVRNGDSCKRVWPFFCCSNQYICRHFDCGETHWNKNSLFGLPGLQPSCTQAQICHAKKQGWNPCINHFGLDLLGRCNCQVVNSEICGYGNSPVLCYKGTTFSKTFSPLPHNTINSRRESLIFISSIHFSHSVSIDAKYESLSGPHTIFNPSYIYSKIKGR